MTPQECSEAAKRMVDIERIWLAVSLLRKASGSRSGLIQPLRLLQVVHDIEKLMDEVDFNPEKGSP